MIGRRTKQTAIATALCMAIISTALIIRTNHHKAAMKYLEEMLKLKVLQVLYPDHHYTRENYTAFQLIPEEKQDVFLKYEELQEEPNYKKESATFFSLVRNEELYPMLQSIRYVEDRFNKRYHYDWLFANDQEFTEEFKEEVGNMVSGTATFVQIPKEMWSYPDHIDQERAAKTRRVMRKQGVKYGGSESYRFMCRFNSGFFYKLKELTKYKYYWRVEPDIKFTCDLDYDYFRYMRENNLKYGFTMSLHELSETVNGLFDATTQFFRDLHPEYISKDHQIEFITQDEGKTFNMCHYWSNFEIGDLDWLRSKEYEDYFQHLENKGGFFYERWGDAPVHTLAASYMLNKNEVHYFDNTGYYHIPHTQCPRDAQTRESLKCTCQGSKDFNWGSRDSCLAYWYQTRGEQRPPWAPGKKLYTARRPKAPSRDDFVDKRDDQDTIPALPERKAFL
jgi:alpha 1,2-mannosyltransferase